MRYFYRIIVLVVFALLSIPQNGFTQQNTSNMIGASFGGSDFHIKDELASPLIFSKTGIAPSICYKYDGQVNRHIAEAQFYYADLTTSSDNFNTENWRGSIRYSYLHVIFDQDTIRRSFRFFLGGSIRSFLNRSDYYYAWGTSRSTAYRSWYWSHSLDIAVEIEYRPSSNIETADDYENLTFLCYVPVVSNVSRPTYSSSGDYNYDKNTRVMKLFGKTGVLAENFSLNTQIIYSAPLFKNIQLMLSYEFFYSSYDAPKEIASYMNNFRAGLLYRF